MHFTGVIKCCLINYLVVSLNNFCELNDFMAPCQLGFPKNFTTFPQQLRLILNFVMNKLRSKYA